MKSICPRKVRDLSLSHGCTIALWYVVAMVRSVVAVVSGTIIRDTPKTPNLSW
jgi:hypothetical protein